MRAFEDELDAGLLPRRDGGLDRAHRIGQGLHLVLEVRADDPDVDRAGDRAARVAVTALEIGGDRDVDGAGDQADRGDHLVARDRLAVRVTVGGGDAVARGGESLGPRGSGDDRRSDRVPDVDEEQELGVGVQAEQFGSLGGSVGHGRDGR